VLNQKHYEHFYIFAVMWSVGAFLELDDRAKLEVYIRSNTNLSLPKVPDSDTSMFDYYVEKDGA
jgi:dynein heavy chain